MLCIFDRTDKYVTSEMYVGENKNNNDNNADDDDDNNERIPIYHKFFRQIILASKPRYRYYTLLYTECSLSTVKKF